MAAQRVLIGGEWQDSQGTKTFTAFDPKTRTALDENYPVSPWSEIETALQHATAASRMMRNWPAERFAAFLENYAARIEAHSADLVAMANRETALPAAPRLKDVELPRTFNQLKLAAQWAREGSWKTATIDTAAGIRSQLEPIGPVAVFGPNNFPFAFNSAAGGDFAAAVAAGNPVIAKGHSSHPGTTRLFAELAHAAAQETGMPPGFIQLIYRTSHADGTKLAAHPQLGAIGYTGSRSAGTQLKTAADAVGKPIYLELSSINPVIFLPGAVAQRSAELAEQFASSSTMGAGQMCTNPGLILTIAGEATEKLVEDIAARLTAAPVGTLLGEGVLDNLSKGVQTLIQHGAQVMAGGQPGGGTGVCYQNTLLWVAGRDFLAAPEALQTEAFGAASLVVVAQDAGELVQVLEHLEGNLTGCVYSATDGSDDVLYDRVVTVLRPKVGRLLNDKMPTGVAVSSAMNHGGPFPATGHPGFTAVGLPAAIKRFARLACYDGVRPARLPATLQDKNTTGTLRLVDGKWATADVAAK